MKRFWNWTQSGENRTLHLEGTIADESWWGDEVTPANFKAELMAGDGPITVWINSPGGDCVAAAQIYNMLMEYPSEVIVQIDGIAASAASVIAMAGTKVRMSPVAVMMIHNPLTFAMGDSDEMRRTIQMLDEVKESIINAYELKSGLSRTKLSHLMDDETWMSAKKALELGFCDEILYVPEEGDGGAEDSFSFSQRTVNNCLLDKLRAHSAHSATTVQSDGIVWSKPQSTTTVDTSGLVYGQPQSTTTGQSAGIACNRAQDALNASDSCVLQGITIGTGTIPVDPGSASLTAPSAILELETPAYASIIIPDSPKPDNRVKAADLERRLRLLK